MNRDAYRLGIEEFNLGRHWHAHHHFEQGWTQLRSPEKQYIQALILSCGCFVHWSKAKWGPALTLCRLAIERFNEAELLGLDLSNSTLPSPVQVPGLFELLCDISEAQVESPELESHPFVSQTVQDQLWMRIEQLRAQVLAIE